MHPGRALPRADGRLYSRQVVKAVEVTAHFPKAHGAPVHIGDPAAKGIEDLARPDFGDAVTVKEGEVFVF